MKTYNNVKSLLKLNDELCLSESMQAAFFVRKAVLDSLNNLGDFKRFEPFCWVSLAIACNHQNLVILSTYLGIFPTLLGCKFSRTLCCLLATNGLILRV